jgi:alkanesulfonate monooxygenase SsuD/methylene tetrahydromethanopterin reductase-like flavin-dependent oxidoreductase (luciferase family)
MSSSPEVTFSIKDAGIMLEPQLGMSMDQLVKTSRLAEELGFGYLFRSDHLLPTNDKRGIDSPECWTSLGAIAASTSKLRFGPLVSPIGFRNPALLAKMACTLHSYSKGRLQLAIGAGWYESEYRSHGYSFPGFSERLAQFREALEIITALVREGRADIDGKYFSAHTDCYPRPHGDLHLIIGARTKSLVRLAGRRADEWNFFNLGDEPYQELWGVLNPAAEGRKVEVSMMTPYLIAKNQSELEASAKLQASKLGQSLSPKEVVERLNARRAPCGTVSDFVEQVRGVVESGVQKVYFQTLVPENIGMIELLADTLKRGVG